MAAHPTTATWPFGTTADKTNPDPLWQAMAVAAAAAKKTHHKTTVDQATNTYATLVANPDGTFTAQQFINPRRAKVGNAWKPIDTALARGADGLLHAKATVASIAFSTGGTGPLATVDDGNGHVLSLGWPGAPLPAPSVHGDTATYPNVYPGVDLQMVALPAGVRDLLIVHDAKAAANPALKTISLRVSGSGLNVAATAQGGVTARTAKGQEIFGGPTPMMWDAGTSAASASATPGTALTAPGARHEALLPATVAGGQVRISPDASLLTSPSTVYPVTIDPQWTENAQNWIELWSDGKTVYDGSPPPYSPYDTSAVRVGNTGGTLVRSLMSFSAMPLPRPGNPDAVGPYQQAMYIIGANLNLTSQSATCPSTQVWRANQFDTGSNWSNQNGGTGTNLWPGSGSDFTNPIATVGGSTTCAGTHFSPNSAAITTQVQDVYNSGGATYTLGLRASNESSTTSNYGSFFVQNNANAANLTVNFAAEPFGLSTAAGNAPVGNHGNSTAVCGTDFSHPGYLPLTAGSVPVSAAIGDWDTRPVSYDFALNDNTPSIAPGYNEAQPDPTLADGTMSGGSGQINVPAYAGSSSGPGPNGTNWSTVSGSVQAGGANGLKDGHMYELWTEMTDAGTDAIGTNLNTALNNAINNAGSSYPHTPPCDFIAAMSAPSQPTITSSTFPASGQHITTGYPTVGTSGGLTVAANAPATPIDHFDWALNTSSTNEGAGNCGSVAGIACGTIGGLATRSATATITIPGSGEHWGDNYLYVSAVDKAGNVSPYGRYDFFLAQAFLPVSFGDVTGDGVPDVVGVDSGGNLVTYQSNLDPAPGASSGTAGTPNTVQAAPASAGPAVDAHGNPTWTGSLYTHRGSERVEPTDDLFAWGHGTDGNGHLYYYFNAELLSNSTSPGLNPAPLSDAFSRTRQAVITRPTCTPSAASGWCAGYDTTWNSVKQIVALGPSAGGCTITAPTTACKTNLITIEADPNGGPTRVWMFSPAGVGQLRNPILLSTSTAAWDWTTAQVLAPGNAAGHPGGSGGLPDLWAVDSAGTLWQFTNTGTPTSLGDLAGKTTLGAVGQFSSYRWVAPSTDPSGKVDLWVMTNDREIKVLTGPVGSASAAPLSPTQTNATQVGWAVAAAPASLEGRAPGAGIAGQLISDKSYDSGTGRQVCLDDLNGSTTNSTTVIDLFSCNGTFPQDWLFAPDGTIQVMGQNPATPPGKCLDTGGSLLQGAKVTLYDCQTNNGFQIWKILPSAGTPGHASLYNPASGLCLDDTSGSTNNTNPYQLWQCLDNSAQRFQLPTGPGQAQTTEAESIWNPAVTNGTAGIQTNCCGVNWSDGAQWWFISTTANSTFSLSYYVPAAGTYQVVPAMTRAANYGTVAVTIDPGAQQQQLPSTMDGYHNGVMVAPFDFGTATLTAGVHTFTFTVTGTNAASTGDRYELGVDTISLVPTASTAPVASLTVAPSAGPAPLAVTADASGSVAGANTIASYTFDFGDGTVVGPQSGPTAQHTYAAGVYVASVKVTDSTGVSVSVIQPVYAFAPPTGLASADGTTSAACAAAASSAPTMASLTPTLSATIGTGLTAQFELRDFTDPSITPPIVLGGAGSTGSPAPNTTLTTPTLANGHEYAFAARSVDANGDVSPVTATCYFWALTSGSQATATGAVGLPFDNTMYPAAGTQTWTGPVTTLLWTNGGLILHRNSDNAVLWASGTSGPNNVLALQNDGNAVIYNAQPTVGNNGSLSGTPLWNTGTSGQGATSLLLAVDGSLSVRNGAAVLWNAPIATHLWALNDGQGRTAADTGFTGGSPATLDTLGVSWPSTSYVAFAGTNRVATAGPVLDTTKSFTVSTWANLVATGGGTETMLVQQATNNSAFYLEYNGSAWQFAMPTADTTAPPITRLTSTNPAAAGTWTHLIGTYDATSGRMALYVNGVPNSTGTLANSIAGSGIFAMGRGFSGGVVGNRFKGEMADVRVYQQAVSDSQAAAMYQSSTFAKPAVPGIAGALISSNSAGAQQMCLDDLNGSLANSTTVIDVYSCNGTWPQAWQFAADGTIRIMGANPATPPNKCLDTGGANTQGSKVTLFDCQPGNGNQQWTIVPSISGPGKISLQNPLTGLCLDNTNGTASNTNPFQLYSCLDDASEHFTPPTTVGGDQKAEAESLWGSASGGTMQIQTGSEYSNGAQQFLGSTAVGSSITLNMYVANPGRYAVTPLMAKAADYGTVTLSVDGTALPLTFDGYNNGITTQQFDFGGTVTLAAGMHSFTFTVTGTNAASTGNRYNVGIDTLTLQPTAR